MFDKILTEAVKSRQNTRITKLIIHIILLISVIRKKVEINRMLLYREKQNP